MDATVPEPTESTPLTRHSQCQDNQPESFFRKSLWDTWQDHSSRWLTLYVCAVFIVIIDVPSFMSEVPKLRMLEMGLCRDYYMVADPTLIGHDGTIPEILCKARPIQSALARMRGILAMLEGIPGLVFAIPYGILADTKGRRLVAGLALCGFVLRDVWMFLVLYFYKSFPTRAVYIASSFLLLGGGSTVLSPVIMAMIAANTPEASRTQAFFWVQVALLVTEIVAPPLGSLLMDSVGAHFAFLATIPLEALAFLVLVMIPKSSTVLMSGDVNEGCDPHRDQNRYIVRGIRAMYSATSQVVKHTTNDMRSVLAQKNVLLGLAALVVAKLARPMLELILQYMSAIFHWPLSKTALLLSAQAAVQIPLFAFVLPHTSRLITANTGHSQATNLILARGSVIITAAGAILMGLAPIPNLFICAFFGYALGNGFGSALGSLLSSLVPREHLSLLFTAIAVIEGLATVGASPLLGLLFSAGMDIGGLAVSLPFFVASVFYAIAAGLLFTFNTSDVKLLSESP